jgi:protoporphyrinogen oxidase
MRILIIGAGPCGLGAAHRLHELGHADFAVYDAHPYVGGLATSFIDDRAFTWDLAVHVAHSHYHYVDRLMDRLLPDGFLHHIRKSWVREYDAFIPYPFQNNIRHLPPAARQECVDGLRALAARTDRPKAANFREWILAMGGEGIARHFMLPYNRKLWTVDPAEMNATWVGDRVPTVDVERVIRNIAEGRDDVAWGPNHTFQFPKAGGTGAIWKALAALLPPEKLHLSNGLVALDANRREARFADGTIEHYDWLISTMPVTTLTRMCGDESLRQRAAGLRHTHVYVVGVAADQPLPDALQDKTWIYCPEDRCPFYRVTPFSLFSPAHVPHPDRQCSFLCEISTPGGRPLDPATLVRPTLDGLRDIGLIDIPEDRAHLQLMTADHGYPIPTLDRDAILADVLPALADRRILSRGRFGGWKYEAANMDHSIMQGVEAAERILLGQEEVTLFQPNLVNAGKR